MEHLYKTKKGISELFDIPLKTLNNDLTEMRRIEQFQDFILKPSHKRVYISIEGYELFLQYKQKKYEEAM
ncbi:TPA: DNA-binding protein [Streptococcus agalactiae]